MKFLLALVLLLIFATVSFSEGKGASNRKPVAWGIISQNSGCVIFEESIKTSFRFYGVAETYSRTGKLKVIETQKYTMDQTEYNESKENMDSLMQRAVKDHIKYVKIPENYTDDQLDSARDLCNSDQRK
jgi:hypothetical protein